MGLLTEWCVLPDFCFGLVAVNTPHLWLPSITGQVVLAINIFPRLYFSEILCSLTVIRLISSVLNVGNKTMRPAEASFYWHLFRRVNEHFLTFFFRNIPLTIWGWHAVISKEKKKRNVILFFISFFLWHTAPYFHYCPPVLVELWEKAFINHYWWWFFFNLFFSFIVTHKSIYVYTYCILITEVIVSLNIHLYLG